MAEGDTADFTRLLQRWSGGDEVALEELAPLVYEELHRVAHRYMLGEKKGHLLQTTALINEAYIRLAGLSSIDWQNRTHFFAVAAQLMRRILVDFARWQKSLKRGGETPHLPLEENCVSNIPLDTDIVALDDALKALSTVDERKSKVVELRFFGGLTVAETAGVLKVSQDTVLRDWRLAKIWLKREMKRTAQ